MIVRKTLGHTDKEWTTSNEKKEKRSSEADKEGRGRFKRWHSAIGRRSLRMKKGIVERQGWGMEEANEREGKSQQSQAKQRRKSLPVRVQSFSADSSPRIAVSSGAISSRARGKEKDTDKAMSMKENRLSSTEHSRSFWLAEKEKQEAVSTEKESEKEESWFKILRRELEEKRRRREEEEEQAELEYLEKEREREKERLFEKEGEEEAVEMEGEQGKRASMGWQRGGMAEKGNVVVEGVKGKMSEKGKEAKKEGIEKRRGEKKKGMAASESEVDEDELMFTEHNEAVLVARPRDSMDARDFFASTEQLASPDADVSSDDQELEGPVSLPVGCTDRAALRFRLRKNRPVAINFRVSSDNSNSSTSSVVTSATKNVAGAALVATTASPNESSSQDSSSDAQSKWCSPQCLLPAGMYLLNCSLLPEPLPRPVRKLIYTLEVLGKSGKVIAREENCKIKKEKPLQKNFVVEESDAPARFQLKLAASYLAGPSIGVYVYFARGLVTKIQKQRSAASLNNDSPLVRLKRKMGEKKAQSDLAAPKGPKDEESEASSCEETSEAQQICTVWKKAGLAVTYDGVVERVGPISGARYKFTAKLTSPPFLILAQVGVEWSVVRNSRTIKTGHFTLRQGDPYRKHTEDISIDGPEEDAFLQIQFKTPHKLGRYEVSARLEKEPLAEVEGPDGGGNVLLNVVNEPLRATSRTFVVNLSEPGSYYLALQNCKTPVPCLNANARSVGAHIELDHDGVLLNEFSTKRICYGGFPWKHTLEVDKAPLTLTFTVLSHASTATTNLLAFSLKVVMLPSPFSMPELRKKAIPIFNKVMLVLAALCILSVGAELVSFIFMIKLFSLTIWEVEVFYINVRMVCCVAVAAFGYYNREDIKQYVEDLLERRKGTAKFLEDLEDKEGLDKLMFLRAMANERQKARRKWKQEKRERDMNI